MKKISKSGFFIIMSVFILVLVYFGNVVNQYQKNIFVLSELVKSRPDKNQYVFDQAFLLKYSEENKEESLKFFEEKYGIEMMIVTVSSLEGKDITIVATELFSKWNIGKKGHGKGVLILLADLEKQIKIEVGLGAEGVFTDLFCGYIERKQLQPYFKNNQVDLGLSATIEEFIGRAEGRITDEDIQMKLDGYLSAGAGIKKDVKIGEFKKKNNVIVLGNDHFSAFSAQPTPEDLYLQWIHSLEICSEASNLSLYAGETQLMFQYAPRWSSSVCNSQYQLYSQSHEIRVKGNYAVLLFPGGKKQGPVFMRKAGHSIDEDFIGWQVDMLSTSKWVRYGFNNEWYLGGRNHPYAFAFKDTYKSSVRDRDFYDDYGKFSLLYILRSQLSTSGEPWSPTREDYVSFIQSREEHILKHPMDMEVMMELAEVYFDLGIAKKSVPLLKKMIEINPEEARTYRYLGLINRDYFVSLKTAINYLKEYSDLNSEDPNGYHYIAVAYWRLAGKQDREKNYVEAAKYMEKFTEFSQEFIYGYKKIGYFYYKAKKYHESKKWFEKILGLDVTHKYAHKMLMKIRDK